MVHRRASFIAIVAVSAWCATDAGAQEAGRPAGHLAEARRFCEEKLNGEIWSRTELYFGLSRSRGPDVTDEEFGGFLDQVVTPRFPDGLTLIRGDGQFRGASGVVVQERSNLLILFYPWSNASNRSIERIRMLYKRDFQQQAVLRVDGTSCVSF